MYVFSLQVMLLDSSLDLPPPVLVVPLSSDVLLLGTGMGTPFGEWVGAVSVLWYTDQHLLVVDQTMFSKQGLKLGLEQMVLPTHQH